MQLAIQPTNQSKNGERALVTPQISPQSDTICITITLTKSDLAYLDHIARQDTHNRSDAVRRALHAFRREEKAFLDQIRRIKTEIALDPSLTTTDEELDRDVAAKVAATRAAPVEYLHVEN